MEKDTIGQLLIYSILANTAHQKKIYTLLEDSLGVKLRKELEGKIKELETLKKELENSLESISRVKNTQEEEIQALKESKKHLAKENTRLKNENSELRSQKNLLETRVGKEGSSDD